VAQLWTGSATCVQSPGNCWSSMSENEQIFRAFFVKHSDVADTWVCRVCGGTRKQKDGSGFTNTAGHVKEKHPDYKENLSLMLKEVAEDGNQLKITSCYQEKVSHEAKRLNKWLEFIVMTDQSFCCVENEYFRKFGDSRGLSRKYLMQVLQGVRSLVIEEIKHIIPDKFGVIFDGWTCDGTSQHYYGFFLAWSNPIDGYQTCLISCGVTFPSDDEDEDRATFFAAEDIYRTLTHRLEIFGKTCQNIDYLGGDNCSVNKKLSRLLDVPFVGCASHRLNLAVKNYLDQPTIAPIINKVNSLMKSLLSLKNSMILMKETPLRPEIRNQTRWSSVYSMLQKYLKIRRAINNCEFGVEVNQHIPDAEEHQSIISLHANLKEVDEVCVEIQGDQNLCDVRVMFDGTDSILLSHLIMHCRFNQEDTRV
jgi:hypothetical protein